MSDELKEKAKKIAAEAGGSKKEVEGKGPSQATQLVTRALKKYTVHRDTTGEPFALPKAGPQLVRALRGSSDSLRAELSRDYFDDHHTVPGASALVDALQTLAGYALDVEPEHLHLRVAQDDPGSLWLDVGDTTGEAVHVTADGWEVVESPPVLFYRTELTSPLPVPMRHGDIEPLWQLVNIHPDDRPLALAILVAQLFPNIAHPIALLLAEHGSGKTSAARFLSGLLDPAAAQVRKPPKDENDWVVAAAGSHVVAVDNINTIVDWWSDALCRAVTGDGFVTRKLYTDKSLTVIAFHRCIWLTTISLPAIRDDLADRIVHMDLLELKGRRLRDEQLASLWDDLHPQLLGALLDLAVAVLKVLPDTSDDDLGRLADFHRIVRAVDTVCGTQGAERYLEKSKQLALDIAAGEPVITTLRDLLVAEPLGALNITSDALLKKLLDARGDDGLPKGWPRNARELTSALTQHGPNLRKIGWQIERKERGGKARSIRWDIVAPAAEHYDDEE